MHHHLLRFLTVGVFVCAALSHTVAQASGGGESHDDFVVRQGTDIPMDHYANGTLGIVLPTYPRIYLYPAWRTIVLGADGLKQHPVAAGGAQRSIGNFVNGWVDLGQPTSPVGHWIAASNEVLGDKRMPIDSTSMWSDESFGFVNCPEGAFSFATETLRGLQKRGDATRQRLANWIRGQDAVFGFCAKKREGGANLPEALPPNEPLYWQHLRGYQIAAAHFYAGHLEESRTRFSQIGKTAGHPMQTWGAYLALRARVRAAAMIDFSPTEKDDLSPTGKTAILMKSLESDAKAILDDAHLASVHEPTRATLRGAWFRLRPRAQFEALSTILDDITSDPYREDRLGDWRRLANDLVDDYGSSDSPKLEEVSMRERHEYYDWMRTIQLCAQYEKSCPTSRAHALKRWAKSTQDPARHRAWLVASLLVADKLSAELEAAAVAVPPSAPEYLTVRYHLSRIYRSNKEPNKARTMSEAALDFVERNKLPSRSAFNLLREERFALSISVKEAAGYLLRAPTDQRLDADTGEPAAKDERLARLDNDGRAWVNRRLSASDIMMLAEDQRLNESTRLNLAIMAWIRAELLGNAALATKASLLAEKLAPAFQPASQAYRRAANAQERRHVVLLNALRLNLSADMTEGNVEPDMAIAHALDQGTQPDVTASMWCKLGKNFADATTTDITTNAALRDKEMVMLGRIKSATGFVGDHVLQRAKTHPADPDLPWLLHVVIQSTRGGCLDEGSHELSMAAHRILHQRFPQSDWASKSRYFY